MFRENPFCISEVRRNRFFTTRSLGRYGIPCPLLTLRKSRHARSFRNIEVHSILGWFYNWSDRYFDTVRVFGTGFVFRSFLFSPTNQDGYRSKSNPSIARFCFYFLSVSVIRYWKRPQKGVHQFDLLSTRTVDTGRSFRLTIILIILTTRNKRWEGINLILYSFAANRDRNSLALLV